MNDEQFEKHYLKLCFFRPHLAVVNDKHINCISSFPFINFFPFLAGKKSLFQFSPLCYYWYFGQNWRAMTCHFRLMSWIFHHSGHFSFFLRCFTPPSPPQVKDGSYLLIEKWHISSDTEKKRGVRTFVTFCNVFWASVSSRKSRKIQCLMSISRWFSYL